MPILGILASSKLAIPPTSYESIATVTAGVGGIGSISFTSIPSTYTHLQLRITGRSTNATANGITTGIRFNGDTGSNYSIHYTGAYQGTAAAVDNGNITNASQMYVVVLPAAGNASSIFGSAVVDILDYKNTNKNKTIRSISGYDMNASTSGYNYINFYSGNWRSTSAVTSIDFVVAAAGNYAEYSSFALYGIKE
jgi:hypothetical protein